MHERWRNLKQGGTLLAAVLVETKYLKCSETINDMFTFLAKTTNSLRSILRCALSAAAVSASLLANARAADQPLAEIVSAAQSFLETQASADNDKQVNVQQLDPRLQLRLCDTPLQTELAPGASRFGRTTIIVRCQRPVAWNVYVAATVHSKRGIVVAARALIRGNILQAGDLTVAATDLASAPPRFIIDPAQAIGMTLTRSLTAAAPLSVDFLAAPLLVKRGAQIMIRARLAELEIHTLGKALADGTEGALIKVQNIKTQRIIEGHVLADGSVLVPM